MLLHIGFAQWVMVFGRIGSDIARSLAALQLLEIERTTGPVLSADDPRLTALATEPFSGLAFVFDPEERRLLPDPASTLNEEPEDKRVIQLPPRAAQ